MSAWLRYLELIIDRSAWTRSDRETRDLIRRGKEYERSNARHVSHVYVYQRKSDYLDWSFWSNDENHVGFFWQKNLERRIPFKLTDRSAWSSVMPWMNNLFSKSFNRVNRRLSSLGRHRRCNQHIIYDTCINKILEEFFTCRSSIIDECQRNSMSILVLRKMNVDCSSISAR